VPTTTITAIAAELKVNLGAITLSIPNASPTQIGSLLKLRAVRSATELSALTEGATRYEWSLKVDPSNATAGDMQAAMTIVKRLVTRSSWDEFDSKISERYRGWRSYKSC
jgi:hypothetical protein